MSILSICTQSVFVQLQKCLFSVGKVGGGGWGGAGIPVGPTFYLLLLFLKNALLSLLFHSKMSFTRKNPEFFTHSLHSLRFNKSTIFFFMEHAAKHQFFSFNPKSLSVYLVLLSQL